MYDPNQVIDYYIHLFAARQDVYSTWVTDIGWRPVRERLTIELVAAGLAKAGPAISSYLITPASASHLFALDYDLEDGRDLAHGMAGFMAGVGLPAYVETSRRGAHLWCVLDRVAPAIAIRAAVRGLLQAAGQPDDPKIELRPGSDTIAADGLGHCLRMPWMPHPLTGLTGEMFDASGTRLGPPLSAALLDFDWANRDILLAWAERWKRPSAGFIPTDHRAPREPFPADDSKASDILRDMWGVANARPGISVRCPAHDDKRASLSILRDDIRAICKAGYCVLNNNDHGRGTAELRKLAPR